VAENIDFSEVDDDLLKFQKDDIVREALSKGSGAACGAAVTQEASSPRVLLEQGSTCASTRVTLTSS
jgi:hypothetical protein